MSSDNFSAVALAVLLEASAASTKCRTEGNSHLKTFQNLVAEARSDIITTPQRAIPLLSAARMVLSKYAMAMRVIHRALQEVAIAERKWHRDSSAASALPLIRESGIISALLPAMSNYLFAVTLCESTRLTIDPTIRPLSVLDYLLFAPIGGEVVDHYENNDFVDVNELDQLVAGRKADSSFLDNREESLMPTRVAMMQSCVRRANRTLALYKQIAKLQSTSPLSQDIQTAANSDAVVADKLLFRLCKLLMLLGNSAQAREGLKQLQANKVLDAGALAEVAANLAALSKQL